MLMRACVVLMCSCSLLGLQAASNYVSSISLLQTAINNALNGDLIVLANGAYSNNTINISKSGITVRAATPGGVILNGTDDINISGSRVTFSGFQFLNSGSNTSGIPIDVTGSQNLLTQLNFDGFSVQKYINIQAPSKSNEVSYCNFRNKPVTALSGNLIHVEADVSVVGYHKIRYCSFQDMPGAGGDNGNECIRLSNGAQSNYIARTLVEYCYFNNTGNGDSEAISIKCRANVIRYCTFTNNPDAMLVFRNGHDNVAYGNFFINAGGIRVKEANNGYIYNNYFQNSGVGGSMPAVRLDYQSVVVIPDIPNPNVCSNINFLHNTFVDCGDIDLGATGPVSNTWANNLFKKSSGNIFINPNAGTSWAGNMFQGILGIAIPSGMANVNPQLVLNANNFFGLSSNSPAIDAASASYPAIPDLPNLDDDFSLLLDISRQARPASVTFKDVGCDEFTTGSALNRPLALSDVGPSYLGGPGSATAPSITAQSSNQTVVVGSPVTFFVVASGTGPLSYQWRKNGTNLVGVTSATNIIVSAQVGDAANYSVVVTNVAGSVTNTSVTLTVNVPPSISAQSPNQTVVEGSPVNFFVVASGSSPLIYQWRKNGSNLVGVTGSTNNIAFAQVTDAGSYTVLITNIAGSITNTPAMLTVIEPPSIAAQSSNQTVAAGSPISFFVVASGTSPFGYQWRKDGSNLVGELGATISIAAAQSPSAGSYTVIVTNAAGSITSIVATLNISITPPLIKSIVPNLGGDVTLTGNGPVGETYQVLATTNVELPLVNWTTVDAGVFTGGIFNVTDTQATNYPQRFYRISTP